MTGEFIAVDQDTGKILWKFQTPSGIIGQPITWEHNGKQYVTITSGTGGVYVLKTPDPNLAHVPPGGHPVDVCVDGAMKATSTAPALPLPVGERAGVRGSRSFD